MAPLTTGTGSDLHVSWPPYRPTAAQPWNVRSVVHMHRRAGFGATWQEVQRDLQDGPKMAIKRILDGRVRPDAETFESAACALADSADTATKLKTWWFYRFLHSPDPLGEKLTLLWHNHFATSNRKINNVVAMRRQNELFRNLARACFAELVNAVTRDPAMLIWLDADSNRQGRPNENLARELMELFTLGIGNYSERDVKESARALTGWSVRQDSFFEEPRFHDDGQKTILGQTGKWHGDDLIRILLGQQATAFRLARRLCSVFLVDAVVDAKAIETLADGLRSNELNIGWALQIILRSQRFFSEVNFNSRIASPVEYIMTIVRALELFDPPVSSSLMAEWSALMGQDLFYPPNVGGWRGGRGWLSGQFVVARANFVASLLDGQLQHVASQDSIDKLIAKYGMQGDVKEQVAWIDELLTGGSAIRHRQRVVDLALTDGKSSSEVLRSATTMLLALPAAQRV